MQCFPELSFLLKLKKVRLSLTYIIYVTICASTSRIANHGSGNELNVVRNKRSFNIYTDYVHSKQSIYFNPHYTTIDFEDAIQNNNPKKLSLSQPPNKISHIIK